MENKAGDSQNLIDPSKPVLRKEIDNEYDKEFNWNKDDPWLGVDVESGYVKMSLPKPVNGKQNEAFYFMYKSKNVDKPRVLVNLIGGPGQCVMVKLFDRGNPLILNQKKRCLEHNPESITDDYHIIYVECPVGCGFSIAHQETCVRDYKTLGLNAVELFKDIFAKNPYLAKADFFFNGESFCGLSLPTVVEALRSHLEINLKGVVLECQVNNLREQCSGQYQLNMLSEFKMWNNCCHKCYCNYCIKYMGCCNRSGCISFAAFEGMFFMPWFCPCGGWTYSKKKKNRFSDEIIDQSFAKVCFTNLTRKDENCEDKINLEDSAGEKAIGMITCTNKFAEMIGAKKVLKTFTSEEATIDIIDHDLDYTTNHIQNGWVKEGISFMIVTGEGDYLVTWNSVYDQLLRYWEFKGKDEFVNMKWTQAEQKDGDPTFYHYKKLGNFEWRRVAGAGHLLMDEFPQWQGRYVRDFMNKHY